MNLAVLPDKDLGEVRQNGAGTPSVDQQAGLELFQRALSQRNEDDWHQLFERYRGMILVWTRHHPRYNLAVRYHSTDSYVALAFERFWLATLRNPSLTFATLEGALSYLKASLNGAILDTLRAYARPALSCLEQYPSDLVYEDAIADRDLWEVIQTLLTTPRERRAAYLLFYCGLKPREIVQFCRDEFPQVQEVHRLRRTIVDRLARRADWLRWQLSDES